MVHGHFVSYSLFFLQPFKNIKPFLAHRLYKNKSWARFGPQSIVLLMPGITPKRGKSRKNIFVLFQAIGKLYLSISSLFSASSAGVLSPQKKSPPTTMLLPASPAKAPETEPIDVAAHLQLLGESLSLIGHRLQETEVSVTVSVRVSDRM